MSATLLQGTHRGRDRGNEDLLGLLGISNPVDLIRSVHTDRTRPREDTQVLSQGDGSSEVCKDALLSHCRIINHKAMSELPEPFVRQKGVH
jgi:hypothetical protein